MTERSAPGLWADVDRYFDTAVDWRCPHCRAVVRTTRRELRNDAVNAPHRKHLDSLPCRRRRAEEAGHDR